MRSTWPKALSRQPRQAGTHGSLVSASARPGRRVTGGADYFTSDVHLSEEAPDITSRFIRFLELVRTDARRLFLLGDIFDYWVGSKQQRMDYVVPVLEKIRELTASGIKVHYIAGNRDFNFDARVNGGPPPRCLPEYLSVESDGLRLLLTHGDLLCTRDRSYLWARRVARSVPVRAAFNHMPLALSNFLSRGYRRLSQRAVARKAKRTTAMNYSMVRNHLREGYDAVISGHVHKAARYQIALPERRQGEFITLGDWSGEGIYLVSRDGEVELRSFQ
ncbi:MAG: UDP-2,3-diacylglucosamine diphosphatase [Planctomycetota bacterium]